jgi:DNA-binding transcriptional LysR family regulator
MPRDFPSLDIRRLSILCEVAERGSLSAAAHALNYATSSVSEQIAILEREVGMRLVQRGARGIRLTEAGEILRARAEEILGRVSAARAELDDLRQVRTGRLRIAAFPTAGALLLPRALAEFGARHPGVELSVVEADPEPALAELAARRVDLALVYEFEGQRTYRGLSQRPTELLTDELHVVLPPAHPLRSRRTIRLERLEGEDWIQGVRHGSTLDILPNACRAAGFEPRIAFQTDDPMSLQGFVAAGLGVAVLSQLVLPAARDDIVVRPLRPPLRRSVGAAAAESRHDAPAVEAMLAVLRSVAADVVAEADRRSRP